MLAQQRDEMIRKTGGKLLEDKPITVDGVPGRAFTIRFIANNLTFLSFNEFILTEHTLYQLSVTIPTEYIALNRAQDVDRFFNSFKLSPE
jgi:hypothetical protein